MKSIWITIILGVLTASAVLGQDVEYEYEDEAPAAPPLQRGRPILLPRQPKAIHGNNNNNKIKTAAAKATKSTSTKAPPVQEEQDEYQDEYDQPEDEPVEVTSTEAPKKTIKPIVRPFRSNDDLLAALKRRRQQVQNTGAVVDKSTTTTSTTTSAPASHKKPTNSFSNGRRGGRTNGARSQNQQPAEASPAEAEAPKKTPQSRRYNSRGGSRAPQPVEDDKPVEEQQQPQTKPKFGRGSRRLAA